MMITRFFRIIRYLITAEGWDHEKIDDGRPYSLFNHPNGESCESLIGNKLRIDSIQDCHEV